MTRREVPVTRDWLERLQAELQELKEVRRPAIVAALAGSGDLAPSTDASTRALVDAVRGAMAAAKR